MKRFLCAIMIIFTLLAASATVLSGCNKEKDTEHTTEDGVEDAAVDTSSINEEATTKAEFESTADTNDSADTTDKKEETTDAPETEAAPSIKEKDGIVRYSYFGADTTGEKDAFTAIEAAHLYANRHGYKVEADADATYYIGHHTSQVIVKTDTDWKNAKFIIDDTRVPTNKRNYWIFKLTPDITPYFVDLDKTELDLSKFKKGSTDIGLQLDGPAMIHITNENKLVYVRAGANSGQDKQQEIVMANADGTLDPSTPLIWDYNEVTSIKVISAEETPITVQGGEFVTRVNLKTCGSLYYNRGIFLNRSNATVYNVKHYLEGEPESKDGSCPYTGFFYAADAANVTFDSCVMTGHRTYWSTQSDGDVVQQGNYDTQAVRCNNVIWKNCTQSNGHNTKTDEQGYTLWGVMASNFCKNITYDGCKLSRFDAHRGVHNVTVINSEIGECINLVGSGTATFENTTLSRGQNNFFIRLREDYGATWEGDIVIKDCTFVSGSNNTAYVVRADWINWDFGYTCYIPNVYIDGLSVIEKNGVALPESNVYVFMNFTNYYNKNYSNKVGHTYYTGSITDKNDLNINPAATPNEIVTKNFIFNDYVGGHDADYVLDSTQKTRE